MPKPPFDFYDLDVYLSSDRSPDNCLQLSDLDCLLTAVAVSPSFIPAEEWLAVMWGGAVPAFGSARVEREVRSAIIDRFHEIVAGLQLHPPVVEPVFYEQKGCVIVSDWAGGFLDGVKLRLPEWSRLIGTGDSAIMIPLAVYWIDDDGEPIISVDDDIRGRIDDEAPELIPDSVIAIHRYWQAQSLRSKCAVTLH